MGCVLRPVMSPRMRRINICAAFMFGALAGHRDPLQGGAWAYGNTDRLVDHVTPRVECARDYCMAAHRAPG